MVDKINAFTFNHSDQPNVLTPGTFSSTELKQKLDSRGEQLRVQGNAIIDAMGLGSNPISVTSPPYYASGSNTATTGSVTSGLKALTVPSTSTFAVNQGIKIAGAGSAGAALITSITAIVGLVISLADAAGTTVSAAAVTHEDTVGIQAAIAEAITLGKKEVQFSNGTYNYGTLTDTSGLTFIGDGVTLNGTTSITLTSLATLSAETATNIMRFGVKLDGVTDDTAAIQAAIKYCFDNNVNLYGVQGTAKINGTIYLPSNPTNGKQITLDFKGLAFQVSAGATLFESGIYSGGVWSSTFAEADDTHMSFGVVLKGFRISGGAKGIRIANWHQGCTIENITTTLCVTAVEAKNCYYSKFDNINTTGDVATPYVGTRFIFSDGCNLMSLSRLTAGNSNIGYLFSGGVTGTKFFSNSVEGCTYGVKFTSQVYDIVVSDCYIEDIDVGGTAFWFTSYVNNAVFTNNYFNFINTSWYAFDYAPLPFNNIVIEKNNMFNQMIDDSYYFKTKDNTAGYNNFTLELPPKYTTALSDLLVNNTNFSELAFVKQDLFIPGAKANLVNVFAVGNYSGCYTYGFFNGVSACAWVDNSNNILTLDTRLTFSDTQNIYVNLKIGATGLNYIKGVFIGNVFYEYTSTGVAVTTNLAIAVVGGYLQITSAALAGNITSVSGEVRLQ